MTTASSRASGRNSNKANSGHSGHSGRSGLRPAKRVKGTSRHSNTSARRQSSSRSNISG